MFDAGIVLNIGLIYRRGAMGTATTPATTPAQKIRIYRYIKKIEGKFFRCKIIGSTIGQDLRKFILRISAVGPIDWSILARKRGRTPEKR